MISIFSSKGNSKKISKRALGMESLENRELLSINPLGYDGADYVQTANVTAESVDFTTEVATGGTIAVTAKDSESVTVTVDAIADATQGDTYTVYYGTSAATATTASSVVTAAADSGGAIGATAATKISGLSADTTYYFVLRKTGTVGDTSFEAAAVSQKTDAEAPVVTGKPAPTVNVPGVPGVTIDTNSKATFTTDVPATVTVATNVTFKYRVVGGTDTDIKTVVGKTIADGVVTSDLSDVLVAGKMYEVWATIADVSGTTTTADQKGGRSENVIFSGGAVKASAPTVAAENSTTGYVKATWTDGATAGTSYKVEFFEGATLKSTVYTTKKEAGYYSSTATAAKVVVTPILNGTEGTAGEKDGITITQPGRAGNAPNAPKAASVKATAPSTDGKSTVSWAIVPKAEGGVDPTGFLVEYQEGTSGGWVTGGAVTGASATSLVVEGLIAGKTYTFRVTAIGGADNKDSAPVTSSAVTMKAVAFGDAKVEIDKTKITSSGANVKITNSKGTANPATYGYQITVTDVTNSKSPIPVFTTTIADPGTTGFTFDLTGLDPKAKYDVVVSTITAVAADGKLTLGKAVKGSITTLDVPVATGKAGTISIVDAIVTITDKDTKSKVTAANKEYWVEWGVTAAKGVTQVYTGAAKASGTDALTAKVTGLTAGQSYTYRVVEITKSDDGTINRLEGKPANFKSAAIPLPSIAKTGFNLYTDASSKLTMGLQLNVKDPSLKGMPGYDGKTTKTTEMTVKYELIVSAKADAYKKDDATADNPVGKLKYGVGVTLGTTAGAAHKPTEDSAKTGMVGFETIDLNAVLQLLAANDDNKDLVNATDPSGFKSMQFQLKTTYIDPNDATGATTQVSYSKVAKLSMPKWLPVQKAST